MANAVSADILLLVLIGGLALSPATTTTADVFCDNLKQVAATLPTTTASSPLHFATAVFGQPPDTVHALALCRGDIVDDAACGECVAASFRTVNATISPPQHLQCYNDAYYYGVCTLVYSVYDVLTPASPNTTTTGGGNNNGSSNNGGADTPFTLANNRSWSGNWSTSNIPGDADDVALTVGLLNELLVKTVRAAASAAPARFATGVMDGSPTVVFYTMAQCTPDLLDTKCMECLSGLLGRLNFSMTLRMGGQLHVVRCFFRYEAYRFYDGEPVLHLGRPSAAPAPVMAPVKHKTVLPPAAAAFLCFIFFCCPWPRTYRKRMVQRLQAASKRAGDLQGEAELVWQGKSSAEFSVFEFEQLREATNNFSEENKLGQGGFGAVYKAWKLFEEERWGELIDASLDTIGHSEEMMRCMNIALLCVQEKAADRPTISDVVAMLGNKSMVLVKPKHPAYFNLSSLGNEETSTATWPSSINDVTISVTTTGR